MIKNECRCLKIRSTDKFKKPDDYFSHYNYINSKLDFLKIPVKNSYSNIGESEEWYKCNECNRIWRLVEPDPPFCGFWGEIKGE